MYIRKGCIDILYPPTYYHTFFIYISTHNVIIMFLSSSSVIYIGLIYLCAVEKHKSINQNSKQKFFLFLFISYQQTLNSLFFPSGIKTVDDSRILSQIKFSLQIIGNVL